MPPVAAWENSVRAGVAVNLTGLTLVNCKFNNYFLPLREKPPFLVFVSLFYVIYQHLGLMVSPAVSLWRAIG